MTDSRIRVSATPSTPSAQCTPNALIHQYCSVSWKRGPSVLKRAKDITIASTPTAVEIARASRLAVSSAPLGSSATASAPRAGSAMRMVSQCDWCMSDPHQEKDADHQGSADEHR